MLFVAEKRAALDVVKKRLDDIGLGEFCLELHSNKTDKGDILHRIESTMALKNAEEAKDLSPKAAELVALREELKAPMRALHKNGGWAFRCIRRSFCTKKTKTRPTF